MLTTKEKQYVRELARELSGIAELPIWTEKAELWKKKNALQKVRPLVLCALPEEAWHEIIPDSELRIKDNVFAAYEWELKKRLYHWEHIKDDEIISNILYVPQCYSLTDWIDGRVRPYSGQADRAAKFTPSITEYSDLKQLRFPELSNDSTTTENNFAIVSDVFGDILDVRLGEPFFAATDSAVMGWGNSLIDILCELRGLGNLFEDLVLAPEFVEDAMDFLMRGTMNYLDSLEREGLLSLNSNEFMFNSNTPLGSNGLGITGELPGDDVDPTHIRCKHLWGYFMAQEFSEVSPDMFARFVLPYQVPIAERFGLTCYGCCEGNDRKWDIITDSFPHLRELSVSHAANLEIAAGTLTDRYVLSWKPNATRMIASFDEAYIRKAIAEAFKIARDCHLVVSLRDTQTLFNEPERMHRWTHIVMDCAMNAQAQL
jgi:hypothetical protein